MIAIKANEQTLIKTLISIFSELVSDIDSELVLPQTRIIVLLMNFFILRLMDICRSGGPL